MTHCKSNSRTSAVQDLLPQLAQPPQLDRQPRSGERCRCLQSLPYCVRLRPGRRPPASRRSARSSHRRPARAPAKCTNTIDLVGTADVVAPARNPLVAALPYSCSFEKAFVVKPALSTSQNSGSAGRRSTALTCATTCAETEPESSSRTAGPVWETLATWNGKRQLRFIAVGNHRYTNFFFISHAYRLGFRPTIPNHPVWRTLSRHKPALPPPHALLCPCLFPASHASRCNCSQKLVNF